LKAVILAAGEGTRLRPFTNSRPKVMIPVANKPVLHYVVRALVDSGVKDIVLVVGYKKERIMSYFGDGKSFGANIQYAFQDKQLGTAHALRTAKPYLKDDFLVVAGDNLINARTVGDLLAQGKGMSVAVTTSDTPFRYGVVSIEGGKVINIIEKPQKKVGNIISTGMYRFTPEVFRLIDDGIDQGEGAMTNILQLSLPKTALHAVQTTGRWMDAVYPWDLLRLNSVALELEGQEIKGTIENNVVLRGPIMIGAGSHIRSGSYIEGPVIIGEGCDIGPHVNIMPSTSIGDNVNVQPFTFIEESLITSNVTIGSHGHLSHCVLDDGARIGPGFRAPADAAVAQVDKEFFHLPRIGALVGENSRIGSGVVISSGCIIGAECKIGNLAKVIDNLENRSIVV
jgi:UDP-N-acetylglucosamine diphosphorylase/glucosamine-1-phosphate N-acetyltransferase